MTRRGINQELSEVFNQLWRLDTNRLQPGTDYTICLQGKAGYVARGRKYARDRAKEPLFSHVDEEKLHGIDTYAHFTTLLDNYETSTGIWEKVTWIEAMETHLFLDTILETDVMKHAHKYLVKTGRCSRHHMRFKKQLYDIWFRLYHRHRKGREDSCGFEHVFVGETKLGKKIMGLHNWVQFYLQEKLGHVDYKGYKARGRKNTTDEHDHVLNLQFSWKGLVKPTGGFFIGVSPEFEIALYTIVFLESTEKKTSVRVKVDEYMLDLVVYRHGKSIGTSYPKFLSKSN